MSAPEKIAPNAETGTDTLDRVLRYAVQQSGVKSNRIERAETRWSALVGRFKEMQAAPRAANPEAVPALIYAEFKPGSTRHDINVIAMTALVLDIDKEADIDRTRAALAGWEAAIYTTKRSTPQAPRLRVILPLAAPVPARDWPGTYRQFALALDLPGLDACAEKLSQPFLAPPGGGYFEHLVGDWLDPAPFIAAARHGFVFPAIAVPPAPTFGLGGRLRVLPAVCAASFARGSVGYLNPGLLAVLDCTQAGRGSIASD